MTRINDDDTDMPSSS